MAQIEGAADTSWRSLEPTGGAAFGPISAVRPRAPNGGQEASWRSWRTELWHHSLGKPPQVVARALAKQQDVDDAHLLQRGEPLLDLSSRADQRVGFRRIGVPEDVRPRPALRTARER